MALSRPARTRRRLWAAVFLLRLVMVPALLAPFSAPARADSLPSYDVVISRVERPPALEDFLFMKPNGSGGNGLTKVGGFIQREPSDGQPASQRTDVYLGYDEHHLYLIFVAFDSEPNKVRARMTRREDINEDDEVGVLLDTFSDQRRAYAFAANPYGIQWDALWSEGVGYDNSYDTLWHSRGKRTDQGFVVWMAIPFKSLRFPPTSEQRWGILFLREIPRNNEQSFWPHISSRVEGQLNQAASLGGLRNISPGRNIQLIPYGAFRSVRSLDTRDPFQPQFDRDRAEVDGGLDAKFVFKDSLVLDVAINPDFSQVESDEPQVTVNQRFEVFFPEKRPFFLENAGFFETPIDLLFTRRIADPQFGVRLTGKLGPYALGAFLIDDESPGKLRPPGDPLHNQRALFAIARVSRDLFGQSSLGFIYTGREFEDSYNRVGGIDGRFKLADNWVASFQGVASATRFLDGSGIAGPAYDFALQHSGRKSFYEFEYNDRSPGFNTDVGFVSRTDIRRFQNEFHYRFRPEGKTLIAWGPSVSNEIIYDHDGTRLDLVQDTSLVWELTGGTSIELLYNWDRERLRPIDFPVLHENRDFQRNRKGILWTTSLFPQVTFAGNFAWGTRINFVPPVGEEPFLSDLTTSTLIVTVRPITPLRIDNQYIFFRLTDRGTDANIFNNHILRTNWNYQFSRELSLRVILQYDSVLANPEFTSLQTTKNLNADFLLTYLINPGTALYVGYNSNAQNIDLIPTDAGASLIRPRSRLINDAKQFFIKFSYLYRF